MKRLIIAISTWALALLGNLIPAQAESFYGLSQNTLFSFDSDTPGTINSVVPISGLGGSENLVGLDLRPATGQLYGLGSSLRLYTIDPITGVATLTSPTSFGTPTGVSYGFDFNPAVDAVRVVNESAQNFRVSPTGSLLGNDVTLAYGVGDPNFGQDPSIVAVGYGRNLFGATGNSLGGIDSASDAVVLIPAPNAGTLRTVGLLGVNTTPQTAFDVSGFSGNAYASLTRPGDSSSGFYSINPVTGSASLIGQIGFSAPLDGLTAAVVPEPSTWALLALGALAFAFRAGWNRI